MSLARKHYQQATAAAASAAAEPGQLMNANAYELQLASLIEHRRRLKELQSIERKIEFKRRVLPEYEPWVEGALASGRGAQDDVLMTVMLWRIDAGDLDGALRIAEYALAHGLSMPDQYKRDLATTVVEEISDQALKELAEGKAAPWQALSRANELTHERDMPDQVRAKLYKACGLEMLRIVDEPSDDPTAGRMRAEAALDFLRRAVRLFEKVGVKKEIERLERYIKNLPDSASPAATLGAGSESTPEQAQSAAEPGAPGDVDSTPPGAPAPES
ncbi:phage terminase small subunit [Lysobacter sp. CA199]|uniref:phage terminase small subunit n=1 Tax=Lysobacter sp. CA199 TaxID=3455608 RepID=UPI003F8D266F